MSTSEGTPRVGLSLALLFLLGVTLDCRAAATRLPVFASADVAATAQVGMSGNLGRVPRASETAGCGAAAPCASKRALVVGLKNDLYAAGKTEFKQLALLQPYMNDFSAQSTKDTTWQPKKTKVKGGPHIDVQANYPVGELGTTLNYVPSGAKSSAVRYIAVDYQTGDKKVGNSKSYARVSMPYGNNGLSGQAVNTIIMPCLVKSMTENRQVTLFPASINTKGEVEMLNFSEMSQTAKPNAWVAVMGTMQSKTPTSENGPGDDTTFAATSGNEVGFFDQSVPTEMIVFGGDGTAAWVPISSDDLAALMPAKADSPGPPGGSYNGVPSSYDRRNCRVVNRSVGGRAMRRRVCRKVKGSG